MFEPAAFTAAIIYGLAASYTDVSERRISNKLTYLAFAVCVALALWLNADLVAFTLTVGAAFAFAYAAFKTGVWAGGDGKFFTVMAGFYAVCFGGQPILFINLFLNSAVASVPVLIAIKHREISSVKLDYRNAAFTSARNGFIALGIWLAIALVQYWFFANKINPIAGAYAFSVAAGFTITIYLVPKVIEIALRKKKKTTELLEGEIIASTIYSINGKAVVLPRPTVFEIAKTLFNSKPELPKGATIIVEAGRARGLTNEEIRKLKRIKGVEEIEVSESMAFAPAILAGFFLTAVVKWL